MIVIMQILTMDIGKVLQETLPIQNIVQIGRQKLMIGYLYQPPEQTKHNLLILSLQGTFYGR